MSNVLKDAKDRLRNVSRESDHRRGRTLDPHDITEHHVGVVVTMDEGERKHREKEHKGTLGKLTSVVRLDEPSHTEKWKEFRRGEFKYIAYSLCFSKLRTGLSRHIYISGFICDPVHISTDSPL